MKTLIIYGTKFRTTEKCAFILKEKLGDADVASARDALKMNDFSGYDNVVVGSNVLMGKLNRHVRKFIKRKKDLLKGKGLYGYVCSADEGKKERMLAEFKSMLDGEVVHAGGLLDVNEAKELYRKIMQAVLEDLRKKGKETPRINEESLTCLASLMDRKKSADE